MTHRIYFLRNTNESDDPAAAQDATLEVHEFDAAYRSSDSSGRVITIQNRLERDTAALFLRRARERGWAIKRYDATPGNACSHV